MRDFDAERVEREALMERHGIHPNAARIGEVVLYKKYYVDEAEPVHTMGVVTSLSGEDGNNGAIIITPLYQMGAEKLGLLGGTQGPSDILQVYDRWTVDRICMAVVRGCGYDGFFSREDVDALARERKQNLLPLVPDDPAHSASGQHID